MGTPEPTTPFISTEGTPAEHARARAIGRAYEAGRKNGAATALEQVRMRAREVRFTHDLNLVVRVGELNAILDSLSPDKQEGK